MTRCCGLWFACLAVAGCATEPSADAQNPFDYCVQRGLQQGTADFGTCVNNYIAQLCAKTGHPPGSEGYGQCAQELQKATFVRQQLQMRGF
jgi:hypothetical protein